MTDSTEGLSLVFGGKDDERQMIYARYAMGDSLATICEDTGLRLEQVYNLMRSCPKDYEESKDQRKAFSGLRSHRQLGISDDIQLKMLECLQKKANLTHDEMGYVMKINKELANRCRLIDGESTANVRIDETITDDVVRERMKALDEAGDGISIE